jgi:hypothetical protein
MGHPGLPDLGIVDGTPMKYTHNKLFKPHLAKFEYNEVIVIAP